MKLINLALSLVVLCVLFSGCSSINKAETVSEAIGHGYVSGLSQTNRFISVIWSTPSVSVGPYSKIDSLTAFLPVGPTNSQAYIFLLGKSSRTKDWEVFSCTTWTNHQWQYVPVTRPPIPGK